MNLRMNQDENTQNIIETETTNMKLATLNDINEIVHSDDFTSDEKVNLIQSNFILSEVNQKRFTEHMLSDEPCENCNCGLDESDKDADGFWDTFESEDIYDDLEHEPQNNEPLSLFAILDGMSTLFSEQPHQTNEDDSESEPEIDLGDEDESQQEQLNEAMTNLINTVRTVLTKQ